MAQKNPLVTLFICVNLLFVPVLAWAHFGTILPARSTLDQEHRQTNLLFCFIHPFEQNGMDLVKPAKIFALNLTSKHKTNLLGKVKKTTFLGHEAWKTNFKARRPGVYLVYMEPRPYWEPAEDCYIQHLTKTYIAAYGDENGWYQPLGVKTEIVPLTRPFGLYAGNTFQGQVLFNGQPAGNRRVEVEFFNKNGKIKAPTEYHVTQVVHTDPQGIFTYTAPEAGWWGFAALSEADYKLQHDKEDKDVELGAILWVEFQPWPRSK